MRWSGVLLAGGNLLLGSGGVPNAAGAAAIRNVTVPGDRISFHDRPVNIGGVNDILIHTHHRGVIGKLVAAPLAAGKADALVAVAVVHAAVVTDVTSPVAPVEPVAPTVPVPVIRSPKRALIGSGDPGAGNPVVVLVTICPVARHPHQVGLGADGLFIDRKHRRCKSDTDGDLCV
jgi:hypothetical protein